MLGALEGVAAAQHGVGERCRLAAIEAAEEARHEERGHLVVGDVPVGIGQRERAPFAGLDVATVALPFDQPVCEH